MSFTQIMLTISIVSCVLSSALSVVSVYYARRATKAVQANKDAAARAVELSSKH